ncbi:TPA: hypothetical protein NJ348_004721 [Vibrio parahaemolyticus]|nr:hypothetical protein [Vibrio parahaemolyticus]TBT24413.1 hypothetical protein D5E85_27610 [Vibrio parahaemolyticus]HCG7147500.1 hypothetical protein [Vibrio parahaemolyticus]
MSIEESLFKTEEEKEMAAGIVKSFIKSVIGYGGVDIKGLSDEEASVKIKEYLEEFLNSEQEINMIIDHKDTLLEEARRLVSENKTDLALVTYATWWEHWINGVLESKLYRKEITGKEFKPVITSLNNRAKTSWFLKLIELPPFDKTHLEVMTKLAEKRNSFVHYKYPVDTGESENLTEFFEQVENSILYFIDYENIHIFQSKPDFDF